MRRATLALCDLAIGQQISIHALREEGDVTAPWTMLWWITFLSTPSVRRATHNFARRTSRALISIHALREEGDGS